MRNTHEGLVQKWMHGWVDGWAVGGGIFGSIVIAHVLHCGCWTIKHAFRTQPTLHTPHSTPALHTTHIRKTTSNETVPLPSCSASAAPKANRFLNPASPARSHKPHHGQPFLPRQVPQPTPRATLPPPPGPTTHTTGNPSSPA
eukprot:366326-Chlamydomonas_euryale.AAC.12